MEGDLPLHLAIKSEAPVDVVKLLVDAFPESIHMVDNYRKYPLENAVKFNASLDIFKTLVGGTYPGV